MTDEYMTLSAALATGLPFKHKKWLEWINPRIPVTETCSLWALDFFEPVWQVQRPKPRMRIWTNGEANGSSVLWVSATPPGINAVDVTDQLKEILKESDNG
jgi:hypothetical protein